MKNMFTQGRLAALIVLVVLVIDQVIKICVKTGMYLHESIHVTDWFYIYFTENNGMAFGMEIIGKPFPELVPHCSCCADCVVSDTGCQAEAAGEERIHRLSVTDSGRCGGKYY